MSEKINTIGFYAGNEKIDSLYVKKPLQESFLDERYRVSCDEIDSLYIKSISCHLVLGRLSGVMPNIPYKRLKEVAVDNGYDLTSGLTHNQALDLAAVLNKEFYEV